VSHACTARCVAGWQASRKCHCSVCGENFSTEANFMRHFVKDECVDPSTRDMVRNKRGVWTKKGEVDLDERFGR
jgi:hypothetical protein